MHESAYCLRQDYEPLIITSGAITGLNYHIPLDNRKFFNDLAGHPGSFIVAV
jgi:hypothetical protein